MIASSEPDPGIRPHSRRSRSLRWATLFLLLAPVLLVASALDASAMTRLHPMFKPGCAGVPTGTKIFSSSGTVSGGVYSYSNTNGASHGAQTVSSAGSPSAMLAGAYYFVGPPTSGCTSPGTTVSGLHATWIWRVTATPYLAANCSSRDGESAAASFNISVLANLHYNLSPFYVFSTHLNSSPNPFFYNVSCLNGGSSIYNPGHLNATKVVIASPAFALSAGTDYDFYTSVYDNTTASATSKSTAVAAVTLTGHLLKINCPRCP